MVSVLQTFRNFLAKKFSFRFSHGIAVTLPEAGVIMRLHTDMSRAWNY